MDIDTDFEDATREQVIEYCRVKYGADHVSRIVTFGTAAARNSIKTIARVLNKPVAEGVRVAKFVPEEPGMTIKKAMEDNDEFRVDYETNPETKLIVDYAKKIEGLRMNRSIHACGVLLADKPIGENYMPLVLMKNPRGSDMMWTTQLEGPECEEMGCLKMDFLGLRTLGVAHETINIIKQTKGVNIVYDDIPIDDLDVYIFLAEGNTPAVFQAESEVFTRTLTGVLGDYAERSENAKTEKERKALADEYFMRVTACNALVRPGPAQYTNQYIDSIMDPSKVKYDDPSMVDQLSGTYGIMLYQEQVMLLCRQMAGFTAGQADTIRKAMG